LCAAIVDRLTVGGDIIETCPHRNQVTPGFTDTTDRNGRDARIQALAQVPVATLAGLPRPPREGERWMTRH
jgi:hypothetical protein